MEVGVSLLVVAVLALIFGGVVSWLVREDRARWRAEMEERRRANGQFVAEVMAQLSAEREERSRLLDRVQNPLGAAAAQWPTPEAQKKDTLLDEVDREWLEDPESLVPYDPDLVLADTEMEG